MKQLAFVFPGQGSQSVGMLQAWRDNPAVKETLQEANDVLAMDIAELITQGPAEELDLTANTQPAMLIADIALWRAWNQAHGAKPAVLAGHSLGEYAALVAAEAISFADALKLVRQRGQWMQEAVPEGQGAMAAVIGMDDDAVEALCGELAQDDVLQAVNFNAPGQVVIAGSKAAVERFVAQGKAAGARMVRSLPVSVPAHSSLMTPVADQLATALASIELDTPRIPVLHNIDAESYSDVGDLAHALAQQVCQPVQWVKTMNHMAARYNITAGLECGPGKVLCGLAKRSIRTVKFYDLINPEVFKSCLQEGQEA